MKNEQLDLFFTNYAESGNKDQRSSVPGDKPLADARNTEGCSAFLPATGNRNGSSYNNVGTNGNYWSSTLNESNTNNAYYLNFNSNNCNVNNNNRNNGHSLRCVQESAESSAPSFPSFKVTGEQLLIDLFKAYYDARKHKRNTRNQMKFEMNLEENLVNLRDELFERTYKVGRATCFIIEDPVKREIFAADFRDRVVHHLVYNYIMPLFERTFIADSYSCRKGKGTLYGIKRLEYHIRSCSKDYSMMAYVLKMDIQGYFMNINRTRLLDSVITELIKFSSRKSDTGECWAEKLDYDLIFYLLGEIILTDPTKKCIIKGKKTDWNGLPDNKSLFKTPPDCGLPIGNLTSQLFSNIYLNRLDNFIKRKLGEKHYGRYVDDSFIVNRNYGHLKEQTVAIRTFLKEEMGLVLHPKKTSIMRVSYGINYLGVFVKPYRFYISNKTAKRMKRKIAGLRQCADIELLRAGINSYLGYMKHLKCKKLKQKLVESNKYLLKYGYFHEDYSKYILNTERQLKTTI